MNIIEKIDNVALTLATIVIWTYISYIVYRGIIHNESEVTKPMIFMKKTQRDRLIREEMLDDIDRGRYLGGADA